MTQAQWGTGEWGISRWGVTEPEAAGSDITAINKAIIELLRADLTLQNLLNKDQSDQCPVYYGFIQRPVWTPCVTVTRAAEKAEVSALADAFDGSRRTEWCFAAVQIDCWSSKNAVERDLLASAVEKCMLKNAVKGALYVQEPAIMVLDELDSGLQPLWRKSFRFKVMYVLEVIA